MAFFTSIVKMYLPLLARWIQPESDLECSYLPHKTLLVFTDEFSVDPGGFLSSTSKHKHKRKSLSQQGSGKTFLPKMYVDRLWGRAIPLWA